MPLPDIAPPRSAGEMPLPDIAPPRSAGEMPLPDIAPPRSAGEMPPSETRKTRHLADVTASVRRRFRAVAQGQAAAADAPSIRAERGARTGRVRHASCEHVHANRVSALLCCAAMDLYDATVPVYIKFLRNLDRWIETAQAHARAKKFDAEYLMQARLAPDQFAFVRQVQAACDASKWAAAKLSGVEAPSIADTETTIEQARARIRTAIAYLESFKRAQFEGAAERKVAHSWMEGKQMRGRDYVTEFAIPNFMFHVTTAYAILRHNGVDLGKMDFLGTLSLLD
jgi:hypothetical protein